MHLRKCTASKQANIQTNKQTNNLLTVGKRTFFLWDDVSLVCGSVTWGQHGGRRRVRAGVLCCSVWDVDCRKEI